MNDHQRDGRIADLERQLTERGGQYAALFNAKRRVEEELSAEKDRNATLERQLAESKASYDEEVAEFNAGHAAAEKPANVNLNPPTDVRQYGAMFAKAAVCVHDWEQIPSTRLYYCTKCGASGKPAEPERRGT